MVRSMGIMCFAGVSCATSFGGVSACMPFNGMNHRLMVNPAMMMAGFRVFMG
jgi:hypothetical protein